MPDLSHGAVRAPRHHNRARRGSAAALRVALGAVFVTAALAAPQVAAPVSVEASSCTGWTSKVSPPQTIRVLRTRLGRIDKVGFRKYVAVVMASGEWPSRLHTATLEAGAVATKQYAWYYALKGNHRSGYHRNGKCYDVRDDTMDQLYRPGRANPSIKQQRAIDKTWGLTLRKNGRFFLTGYRAGSTSRCGADANGWKLYAKSVEACAAKGWSRARIQQRYLSPNLSFVWSDRLGPVVQKPSIALRPGNTIPGGAATLAWRPASKDATVSTYKVQRKVGQGPWKTISQPGGTVKRADVWLKTGYNNRFRVFARDAKDRRGPWAYSPRRKAALRGPVGLTLSGAEVELAGDEPIRAKTRFTGRAVAFVTDTGPGMGQAKVFVNGKKVATLDLERTDSTERTLVWARNWSASKRRSITVKAMDPDARVDFEGFYILR
jgi:hypothetical protein